MTERMTTIPPDIEILAERTNGVRVWIPEVRGQVFWPQLESHSSTGRETLEKAMRELTPTEHQELLGKMTGWADACLAMAQRHAKHLGDASIDEIVEDDFQRDPAVISDCIALAAHLYRASRGEADPGPRW